MCDPASLAIAAGVASAAGSLVSGYSALSQGKYESGIARQNAQLERSAAEESIRAGYVERRDFWRQVGQLRGQQAASMAANGLDLSFGTPERIQQDTTAQANEDASELYRNIEERWDKGQYGKGLADAVYAALG